MAHAYTPGLKVTRFAHLERDRRLPLKGDVTVSEGDTIAADHVVARTELPGNVHMVNIAGILNKGKNVLGMMPHPERAMEKQLGSDDGRRVWQSLVEKVAV